MNEYRKYHMISIPTEEAYRIAEARRYEVKIMYRQTGTEYRGPILICSDRERVEGKDSCSILAEANLVECTDTGMFYMYRFEDIKRLVETPIDPCYGVTEVTLPEGYVMRYPIHGVGRKVVEFIKNEE